MCLLRPGEVGSLWLPYFSLWNVVWIYSINYYYYCCVCVERGGYVFGTHAHVCTGTCIHVCAHIEARRRHWVSSPFYHSQPRSRVSLRILAIFFLAGLADKKVPLTPSSVSTVLGLQVQARLHGGLSPIWVLMVSQQALLTSELFLQPSKNISLFI